MSRLQPASILVLSLLAGCARIGGDWSRTHYELYPVPGRVTVQTPTFTQSGPFFTKVGTGPLPFAGLVLGPFFAGIQFFGFSSETEAGWVNVDQMGGLQGTASDVCCGTASVFEGSRVGAPAPFGPTQLQEFRSAFLPSQPPRLESWRLQEEVAESFLQGATEWIPASAAMLVSFDAASFSSGPFGESGSSDVRDLSAKAIAIDPRKDVRSVSYFRPATRPGRVSADWGAVLKGHFDEGRVVSIVRRFRTVSRIRYRTSNVYILRKPARRFAMAFPDSTTALFGTPRQVLSMLATGWGRAPSLLDGPLGERLPESARTSYFFAASPVDARVRSISLAYAMTDAGVSVVGHAVASDSVVARRLAEVAGRFSAAAREGTRAGSFEVNVVGREVETRVFSSYETLRAADETQHR